MAFEIPAWLRSIAPTIVGAVGTPAAGLAVEAVLAAFGGDEQAAATALKKGTLTGEQLAAMKAAEISLQERLAELGIDLEKIHAADRASAREMAAKTGDTTPTILSYSIVGVWAFINYLLFRGEIPEGSIELVARVLGTLDAALMAVLYYYFGSSSGSKLKTTMLGKEKQ